MRKFLSKLRWLVLAALCLTAGTVVLFNGCPQELASTGLSLFHVLALVCCAFCAVHCFKEFMK